ncbi:MAG TPA: CHAT domain-containing protein [Kofleriaceae bacterium]|nr:CHAT domain-containing protein [Kofleriaceae bacterium]
MKHTILFLAANPTGTDRLALDREARAIQVELERSGHRDRFELETRWAAEPLDLLRELRKLRPTVVHYSGHGGHEGLYFQAVDGTTQLVSTDALEATVGAAGASVQVIVLNACYTEPHAEALLAHVDCVVGTSGALLDDAARSFAIGFYGGLAEGCSVAAAYRQGCAAIRLEDPFDGPHRDIEDSRAAPSARPEGPQLKVRPGVDAERLVLANPR